MQTPDYHEEQQHRRIDRITFVVIIALVVAGLITLAVCKEDRHPSEKRHEPIGQQEGGADHATEARSQQSGYIFQYKDGDEGGKTAEAGGGYRAE